MPWSEVSKGRYERAVGESETFIKILADAARPLNREHWAHRALNFVVAVTPIGTLAHEDLSSLFREAWNSLRFDHPIIAAFIVDEATYVYDVPNSAALEKWASETFRVVEDKTADEMIACMTPGPGGPYATMTYLSKTHELLGHSQHWRTDGVGGFILLDDFLALAARSSPPDASSLPWGQETARLAPPIEDAANIPVNPSADDKQLGEKCVGSFGAAAGAIGIISRAPAETPLAVRV